ncbi:MAG TPA: hypothetical protein VNG89_15730 [Vicinamibacterales bacterium]|nr:hypothetical protein [Vicinamibacterales bacterium]
MRPVILSILLCAAMGSLTTNGVQVNRAVRVKIAKETPALSIDYSYAFPEVDAVRLRNVGVVPPAGHFHYITTDDALVFENAATGSPLARYQLHETVIVAAQPPLIELPRDTDFPAGFRSYRWHSRASLPQRAFAVLAKTFRYRPFEIEGRNFVVTTFAPVGGLPDGITAQVAVLLSFPYDRLGDGYDFHVQSLVREGRSHSMNTNR